MSLSSFLQPHGGETPSGEDLEYDPEFTAMELAAQAGEERQVGDEIIAAEEPDYRTVAEKARTILERSHDLRAGVHWANAELRLNGLSGFAEATAFVRGCLEEFWETCHPQLDADDDDDPTMRVNAVLALADDDSVVRGLRRAPLTESRTFGRISLRDIAIADGEITPREDEVNIADSAAVVAAFQDTDPEFSLTLSAAAKTSLENIRAIGAVFDEKVPGRGPNFDPVIKALGQITNRLGHSVDGDEAVEAESESDGAGQPSGGGRGGGGGINSPTDVQAALDKIIAYYARYEPSSPVPLLLTRAKRLVSADFLTIMKDMAPSGVDNVNLIGGLDDEEY